MTTEQFAYLAASGESETLEFKATTGMRREAVMTVCAFLNQGGGQVLFGVTETGAVVGQQVSERTIEELSAELRRIEPPAFPTVERVACRTAGSDVIVVSTASGSVEAIRLSRQRLPTGREHHAGHVRRRVQPDALRANAQRAALGEPGRRQAGRSTTSTWRRFAGRSRRRSGAGDFRSL